MDPPRKWIYTNTEEIIQAPTNINLQGNRYFRGPKLLHGMGVQRLWETLKSSKVPPTTYVQRGEFNVQNNTKELEKNLRL